MSRIAPRVIGHRGARGVMPENTIAGFERALDLGADMIEIDVQVTADGVPAVVHDDVLTGALYRRDGAWLSDKMPVQRTTWAELQTLDAGAARPGGHVALMFPDQRRLGRTSIPRLSEVLALCARRQAALLLEIKRDATDASALSATICAESVMVEILSAPARPENITFQSFDWSVLDAVRGIFPSARIFALTSEAGQPRNVFAQSPWLGPHVTAVQVNGPARAIADLGWQGWSAAHQDLTPLAISQARDAGLDVFGWTVNDAAVSQRLARAEIDGVITDFPELIGAALARMR